MIQLNQGQQQALNQIKAFLMQENQKYFILSGYAGTGKTTLLKEVEKELPTLMKLTSDLKGRAQHLTLVYTATTNKAASVLALSLKQSVPTIHSFLKLRPVVDGKRTYLAQASNMLLHNTLIIIDEASYVDSELAEILDKSTDSSCKIIYTGDRNQLAPVSDGICYAYNQGYPMAQLTELMRQPESDLQNLCLAMFESVDTGLLPKVYQNGKDISLMNREDFEKAILNSMTQPSWKPADSKYIAWRNAAVNKVNQMVKAEIAGQPRFSEGDLGVCNSYIKNGNFKFSTDSVILVENITHDLTEYGVSGYTFTADGVKFFSPYDVSLIEKTYNTLFDEGDKIAARNIKETWMDLRPAYACTVHKSQGSTFHTVFLDLKDIKVSSFSPKTQSMYFRMLYVGISRASHRLVVCAS